MKFRKKPVVIEAHNLLPETAEFVAEWCGGRLMLADNRILGIKAGSIEIETLEGVMTALPGDWIIRSVAGEFYPCRPDIFAATCEPVADEG